MENEIHPLTIKELLTSNFLVPSYQRGYRWGNRQVEDLLDDINEFSKNPLMRDNFYYLQPIIVSPRGEQWELIDGQQRLTTIYVILKYLNESIFKTNDPIFSLEYESRPNSRDFLQNIDLSRVEENIDFYYIGDALKTISAWFSKQESANLAGMRFYQALLERTRVIWYQVNDGSDPHDIFIRINSGKIPLTNAELIKALFLKKRSDELAEDSKSEFEKRQLEISTEWDNIEAELQIDAFWYFLNKSPNKHPTRIEFIFSNIANLKPTDEDEYATFRFFNEKLEDATKEDVLKSWQEVKQKFLTFKDWFNNREWYHLVGYLLAVGEPLQNLQKNAAQMTKSNFKNYLIERIRSKVNVDLVALRYPKQNEQIKNILLLFNVETIRKNPEAGYYFPFHLYKGIGKKENKWSIEHIHAQRAEGLNSSAKYRAWLIEILPFVDEASHYTEDNLDVENGINQKINPHTVKSRIEELLQNDDIDKTDFEIIQDDVLSIFGPTDLHTIDNLALLTGSDNSSLNNGPFPVKRNRIISLEKKGSFIPISTRNVFLKYYNTKSNQLLFWTKQDREKYLNAIKTTLAEYLP